jgi:hypothetical protein
MNKSIAVFAVFVLVSTAALAQVGLNKTLIVGTTLGVSDFTEDSSADIVTDFKRYEFILGMSGWGSKFGFHTQLAWNNNWAPNGYLTGYAFWDPLPILRIGIGNVGEVPVGMASGQITGWGLHNNGAFSTADYGFWWGVGYPGSALCTMHGFYTWQYNGSNQGQAELSGVIAFYPSSLLGIKSGNLALRVYFPTLAGSSAYGMEDSLAKVYWDRSDIQISYDMSGLGEAALTLKNSMRVLYVSTDSNVIDYYDKSKGIFAQWRMNLPMNMGMEAGVHYTIAPSTGKYTAKWPINVGLGWRLGNAWTGDDLVLTSRLGFQIPMEDFQNFIVGWDFVLNYKLMPNLRLYIPVGLSLVSPSRGPSGSLILAGKNDDPVLYWNFAPYIVKNLGGPQFYACFVLHNGQEVIWPPMVPNAPHDGKIVVGSSPSDADLFMERGKRINWSVPLYLALYF